MTFIVTLIGLLIERFFDWSHLRSFRWYDVYQAKIATRIGTLSPYLVLAVIIIPLLLLVAMLNFLLRGVLYGFLSFLFAVCLFIYCLGPKNLWADSFRSINGALDEKNHASIDQLVNGNFAASSTHKPFLNYIFVAAHRRIFAIVFWYAVLGPLGMVLYRAITLSAKLGDNHAEILSSSPVSTAAQMLEKFLDWIPVRLFTFLFALGGHFTKVLICWRHHALAGLSENDILLTECGCAALGIPEETPVSVEKAALSLLDRVFIIMLVLISTVVLVIY